MLADWMLRLRALFRRAAVESDIDEELRFHLDRQVDAYTARGFRRADAVRQAQLEFGGFDQIKEEYRDALGVRLIDTLWRDLRVAVRGLRSTPFATVAAILSLTLGIGANTAIFSLLNSLVLKPLPVSEPQQLFWLSTQPSTDPLRPLPFSYATFKLLRQRSDLFEGALGAWSCCTESNVSIGGHNQIVESQFVTGDFFATLGIHAIRGRLLTPADDEVNAPDGPVAVLGYGMWQRLGGRDDVVGSRLMTDGVLITVIGVAPPEFRGLEVGRAVDLTIPQHLVPRMSTSPFDEDTRALNVLVRLRQGVTSSDATAALQVVQAQIREASAPKKFSGEKFLTDPFTLLPAATGISTLRERFERPLVIMFVVVTLVLLIACLNIGNLLLARAVARRHELGVRVAIGASRWRLVQQFFVESFLLAIVGAVAGLLVAAWTPPLLLAQLSNVRAPILLDTPIDWSVLAFTAAVTVTTAIVFGTIPALRATDVSPIEALKLQRRGADGNDLIAGLIVVQMSLSLLLVVWAGLFLQTFNRLGHVALGFDRDRTLVIMINAPTIPAVDRPIFFDRLAQRVATEPLVEASGGALSPPIVGSLAGNLVVSAPGTLLT